MAHGPKIVDMANIIVP